MTLASVKKLAIQRPEVERMKLAEALLQSLPPMREPVTLAELEARADAVISGKVAAISEKQFDRSLSEMEKSITQIRPAQRG